MDGRNADLADSRAFFYLIIVLYDEQRGGRSAAEVLSDRPRAQVAEHISPQFSIFRNHRAKRVLFIHHLQILFLSIKSETISEGSTEFLFTPERPDSLFNQVQALLKTRPTDRSSFPQSSVEVL